DDLLVADVYLRRIAVVLAISGADHRVAPQIRNGEDNAPILVLHDIGLLALVQTRHDDVTALDQADAVRRVLFQAVANELRYPGPGSIDQRPGAQRETTPVFTLQLDMPDFADSPGAQALRAGVDMGAFFAGRHGVEHHQP